MTLLLILLPPIQRQLHIGQSNMPFGIHQPKLLGQAPLHIGDVACLSSLGFFICMYLFSGSAYSSFSISCVLSSCVLSCPLPVLSPICMDYSFANYFWTSQLPPQIVKTPYYSRIVDACLLVPLNWPPHIVKTPPWGLTQARPPQQLEVFFLSIKCSPGANLCAGAAASLPFFSLRQNARLLVFSDFIPIVAHTQL